MIFEGRRRGPEMPWRLGAAVVARGVWNGWCKSSFGYSQRSPSFGRRFWFGLRMIVNAFGLFVERKFVENDFSGIQKPRVSLGDSADVEASHCSPGKRLRARCDARNELRDNRNDLGKEELPGVLNSGDLDRVFLKTKVFGNYSQVRDRIS